MAITNLIVNGSFDAGSSGWSGTDIELNPENSYFGNGSTNRVAEMDGTSNQVTVLQQTFRVTEPGPATLGFRTALRNSSQPTAGEGFIVRVLNSAGTVIFQRTIQPTTHSWQTLEFDIHFPTAGNYTLRFTEIGPNDSLGAVIDDIEMLICFTAGTLIEAATGPRPVESLASGDLILTADHRLMPVQWIGRRCISQADQQADSSLRPVIFEPGSLGRGLPERRLAVSPQHRMLISGWKAQLHFGEDEVLVPAISLVNGGTIRQAAPEADVIYVHFLLDGHQIVLAEGCETESFHPNDLSLRGLASEARSEVLRLFPDLDAQPVIAARPVVRHRQALVLAA